MKQVRVIVPYDKTELVYTVLVDNQLIRGLVRLAADNANVIQFGVKDEHEAEVVENLKGLGVGIQFGFIDILEMELSLPHRDEYEAQSQLHREAQIAVEEMHAAVSRDASLDFDFFALVVLTALIAGLGLMIDNGFVVLASMLLSPLMGPVVAVAFGYVVRDKRLAMKGTLHELIALGVACAVGAFLGVAGTLAVYDFAGVLLGTHEILARNGFLWIDLGIAILTGAGVAVSITRGGISALVGVAMSESLMPLAIMIGMCSVSGFIAGSVDVALLALGAGQMLLMNIVVIDLAAVLMFRVKKLSPVGNRSATWTAVTQFRRMPSSSLYHKKSSEK